MARRSVIAFAIGGLCAAAAMIAVAQHYGQLEPIIDSLSGADEPDPGPMPALKLVEAFPKLKFDLPLWFGHDGTGSGWLYVCEQDGKIWRFKKDGETRELFLDITDRVAPRRPRHNEEGLLALAFHPKFKENRQFFVHYSQLKSDAHPRRGVTSRFTANKDGVGDPASEKMIFEIEQPWGNHNGCTLLFGKDGYLYSSFGDGGSGGDPLNSGQRMDTWLGKVLRMDIDKPNGDIPYSVPRDNPFVDKTGVKPEIWAYGLRNVWRMAFDAETGLLWGGDVGQNAWEEIDIIEKGGNYGWKLREGFHAYGREREKPADMIDPVIDYDRKQGISVTGGVVYRGKVMKELQGVYLYADYGSGRVWGLDYDLKEKKMKSNELLVHAQGSTISSFGEDADGEVYACGHARGKIFRLEIDKKAD